MSLNLLAGLACALVLVIVITSSIRALRAPADPNPREEWEVTP